MSNSTPSSEHVKFEGYTVPVYDYLLGGEVEQLEQLMRLAAKGELTDYQNDLECFLVCARHRVPEYERLTREDFAKVRMTAKTRADLRAKVERLVAPFVDMQLELNKERGLRMMAQLTPEKLEETIAVQELLLAQMKDMRRIGKMSATASSPATN
jgi:hypothetical protein